MLPLLLVSSFAACVLEEPVVPEVLTEEEPPCVDETWYPDADGDGFGDAAGAVLACAAPGGFLADATDCDDTQAAVNPAATEVCNATDDDCDGVVDEDDAADASTWYADADADGFGDAAASVLACAAPGG
ncbi:MAG: putative metal-binding motif-containing protein [Pseudomonadota bacterium]|nr:putative metal-binding motif-containing protein [Pseudomonadota bacterium]